jgi:hypothetical protein
MFEVKYLGRDLTNNKAILSGVAFGHIGKPLYFEMKAEGIDKPLTIKFLCNEISGEKPLTFVSKLQNSTWVINFTNPSRGGTSGFTTPYGLALHGKVFGLICYIDTLKEGNSYRLTYEFYEGEIEKGAE